jgi:hypothetical protein
MTTAMIEKPDFKSIQKGANPKVRTEEINGIYFPTDIPVPLWMELKKEPDFIVRLIKIHKFGHPNSELTAQDFEQTFMIRAAFEILNNYYL